MIQKVNDKFVSYKNLKEDRFCAADVKDLLTTGNVFTIKEVKPVDMVPPLSAHSPAPDDMSDSTEVSTEPATMYELAELWGVSNMCHQTDRPPLPEHVPADSSSTG